MSYLPDFLTILLSTLGGVLPALLWLWFWRQEDKLHPEPRYLVALAFMGGMISVFVVLFLEKFVFIMLDRQINTITFLLWAIIEETIKYLFAFMLVIRRRENDEPIDALIYMVTVALGFSALENTLFLLNIFDSRQYVQGIITGNMRFLGATLLHTACSAVVGLVYGMMFYNHKLLSKLIIFLGIVLAIVLHTIFNLLIMNVKEEIFFVFAGVWLIIITIILSVEKLKNKNIYV